MIAGLASFVFFSAHPRHTNATKFLSLFRQFIYHRMSNINAVITGVGMYLPEYRLTNDELSKMVDTNDEWIMSHMGIKERRILKDKDKASAFMGAEAVKDLLQKTGTKPEEIDLVICATVAPDYFFPQQASSLQTWQVSKMPTHSTSTPHVQVSCTPSRPLLSSSRRAPKRK